MNRIVFSGQYNQSGPFIATSEGEYRSSMMVEEVDGCIHTVAGCQKGYLSLETGVKMATSMLAAAAAAAANMPAFAYRLVPKRESDREVIVPGSPSAMFEQEGFVIGDRFFSRDKWGVEIVPNPSRAMLENKDVQGLGVLVSTVQAIANIAKSCPSKREFVALLEAYFESKGGWG